MIDYHVHTDTSPDSEQALGSVVAKAREIGIKHLAITDHYDFFEGKRLDKWTIKDLQGYKNNIFKYKGKFDDIDIALGIEIGYVNSQSNEIKKVLDALDYDFIIGSTHIVGGLDPYFPDFFEGKTKEESYYRYLKTIKDSVDVMDERFSVIGHIGYAARYAPYEDKKLRYEDFSEIIDDILIKVVKRGFGLEINTSNYGRYLDETMPCVSIINRYRELGGEIITIGSDAHKLDDIGKEYNTARQIALDAGFRHVCVFKNLKPQFIDL